ncbi:hypothetical protein [Stenotrophomonas lactitubi]|uniref:hypothetical protein n=1 Tax=Stenotrophomonas lactitubi TaxID=2045214 RepID=UPI0038779CE6
MVLAEVYYQLSGADWSKDAISSVLKGVADKFGVKLGKIAHPIRNAIAIGQDSPDLSSTIFLTGKVESLSRIKSAQSMLGIGN